MYDDAVIWLFLMLPDCIPIGRLQSTPVEVKTEQINRILLYFKQRTKQKWLPTVSLLSVSNSTCVIHIAYFMLFIYDILHA